MTTWYRHPGGSLHAFSGGLWTLCKRFIWQASWALPADSDERCSVCAALADPPVDGHPIDRPAMSEQELIAAHGGLPIE